MGDSLAVDLAKLDLEREASERHKGFVVRNRLKRVSNEAVRCSAFMRKEELRRYSDRYIEFVKSPDGHMLRSNREMREAFWAHFRDRFARYPDLPVQEFLNYLADFPRLGAAEAASCECLVAECEVRNALKQVGLNKSPGLEGLPYEVYLRLSHMFVPILTDVFNHWFAQGAIPGSITKGVIKLLKKGGRHVWDDLDDYRPITESRRRPRDETLFSIECRRVLRNLPRSSDLSWPRKNLSWVSGGLRFRSSGEAARLVAINGIGSQARAS